MAILHPHHLVLLLWTVSAVLSQDFQTLDPDLQPSQIDYGILQGFCMSQPTTSDCPVDMQFCKSAADCPAQFACSCMKGCGNLSCLLPENVQVCGCHPPPRNGYTLNRIGSVEFGCDPGFQLVGVEKKTCREGVWRPAQDFPKCNVLMCEELASISNGNTYFNPANEPTMFNSTATHQCLSGYTLVGSAQQTCQTTGQWSGQLPSCQRDGRLSNWTDWSECDALCSRGLKRRSRVCIEPDDGGQSCPADDLSEVDVCDSGKQCETSRLGCFSQPPWQPSQQPIRVAMIHEQLDNVHRCLHRCRQHKAVYATVRGPLECWCFNEYQLAGSVPSCTSTTPVYEVYPVPQAAQCYRRVSMLVSQSIQQTIYVPQRYTTGCGFWNWSRCTRYRSSPRQVTVASYKQTTRIVKC